MPYRNHQSIVSIVSPRTASACVHVMPHASMLSALIGLSTMYIVFADCITRHCSGSHGAPSFGPCVCVFTPPLRSEEHTSELQSLMRISYAVFCLKKKKATKKFHTKPHSTIQKQEHTPPLQSTVTTTKRPTEANRN